MQTSLQNSSRLHATLTSDAQSTSSTARQVCGILPAMSASALHVAADRRRRCMAARHITLWGCDLLQEGCRVLAHRADEAKAAKEGHHLPNRPMEADLPVQQPQVAVNGA